MTRRIRAVGACATMLVAANASAQVASGPRVQVEAREAIARDVYFLYSPATARGLANDSPRVWIGGWSSASDMPRDRIFTAMIRNGGVDRDLTEALALPGALVNDPAVTAVPGQPGLRMYFTRLSLDDVDRAVERNTVWTATSLDGGLTWQDPQEAIGQSNGVNACGAWSPSVLVEGGLVCVYYHGNSPCLGVYRTCFRPDGVTPAGSSDQLDVPFDLANVDVARVGGRYVMVGDTLGLPDLLEIRALESLDGLAWQPLRGTADGLLVKAESGIVFTPHIADVSEDGLTIMFASRSSLELEADGNVLHRWTLRTPGPAIAWAVESEVETEGADDTDPSGDGSADRTLVTADAASSDVGDTGADPAGADGDARPRVPAVARPDSEPQMARTALAERQPRPEHGSGDRVDGNHADASGAPGDSIRPPTGASACREPGDPLAAAGDPERADEPASPARRRGVDIDEGAMGVTGECGSEARAHAALTGASAGEDEGASVLTGGAPAEAPKP